METEKQLAPSVVAVMVVHEPGDWFDETLQSLAAQDYPNLRTLFLVVEDRDDDPIDTDGDAAARIRDVIPSAFVRSVSGNAGFGPTINEVLRLVEGDNGFFLLCHDDVALQPDVVRLLVAELFRSNAGVVGPKLTEWHQPRMLQHVGLGLDRFGEVDPIVDPGEADQEQHDAVRDVFVLPSACILIRADLFRTLGGYDPAIDFHGDDVDLCWRAHLTGARVIVAPDARVRHLEQLVVRRPDLHHGRLRARHRMRSVATLTGGSRLLGRSIQLVLLTMVELVVGLFTGRLGEALSSFRALGGLIPRTGALLARRRAVRGQRVVPEREVLGLQDRGSSRLTSYLRGKDTETYVGADSTVRRWREASFGPLLAWVLVIVAIVIGSRDFIQGRVPAVGEFLPFPESPGDLWTTYRGSFDSRGFGATTSLPTGYAIIAVTSVLALFHMSLLLTMSVIGSYLLGALGAWRLATVFPMNRARVACMVIYVGTPLVPGLLSRGDWSALVWFAALPWLVHLLRRAAGLETADPDAGVLDLADGVAMVSVRHRARAIAFLSLVLAVATAFVPVVIALWAVVGLMLAVGTVLAGSSFRVAAWFVGCTAVSVVVALALNLPWALDWSWERVVGARPATPTGRDLVEIATLAPTTDRFAILAVVLYLPLLAAVAISRAWRLTWSVRAAVMVLGFLSIAIFAERGSLGVDVPATSLLSVPIALGLALAGAAVAGGFGSDVLSRGFGWRQPIALLANGALVLGVVPAVLAIGQGAWHTPDTPMVRLLEAQLPADPAAGDYRVLYVGDPRVIPVVSAGYADGIAYGVTDAGAFDFTDRFLTPVTEADAAVVRALDLIADGSTLRAGRILAPLGIRYVVVPKTDGVVSTVDDPIPLAGGLVPALQNQLDLGSVYGPPTLEIFVNQAWIPAGAQLTGATAAASQLAGEDTLARADLSEAVPSMVGFDRSAPTGVNDVVPGVLHVAVPFDDAISLTVDGVELSPRPGFGVTTAFDVEVGGRSELGYARDANRGWWRVAQMLLWLAVLAVAAGARSPFGRRRSGELHDETLIDLSDAPPLGGVIVGEALPAAGWDTDEPWEGAATASAGSSDLLVRNVPDLADPSDVPIVAAPEPDDGVDLAALVASVDDEEPGGAPT
ncbi:MAG: glycosyltransferase [Ilumatobacteraceae bacterium]